MEGKGQPCVTIARFASPGAAGDAKASGSPSFVGDRSENTVKVDGSAKPIDFDIVSPAEEKVAELYNRGLQAIIAKVVEGINVCVCVYGNSGSGQPKFLIGDPATEEKGVVELAVGTLFKMAQGINRDYNVVVRMCHFRGETPIDLLCPRDGGDPLEVKADRKTQYAVADQSFLACRNEKELATYVAQGLRVHGELVRRGHFEVEPAVVVEIAVESQPKGERAEHINSATLRFALISTGGLSSSVDNGLQTFGTVVSALSNGNDPNTEVPYNKAALTKLLRQGIGGNSQTVMVAALAAAGPKQSTRDNLELVSKARAIRSQPVANRSMLMSDIQVLRKEIRSSRAKMQLTKPGKFLHDIDKNDLAEFQSKIAQLETLKSATWEAMQQTSIEWSKKRKSNLRALGLLHVLQEPVHVDQKLSEKHEETLASLVQTLMKINSFDQALAREEKRRSGLIAKGDESKIKGELDDSKTKSKAIMDKRKAEVATYQKTSKLYGDVMKKVVEQEEKRKTTFMMSAEQLQVFQAEREYRLLNVDLDKLDMAEVRELLDKKKDALEKNASAGQGVKDIIKERFDAEKRGVRLEWENRKLRETLVENKFRYDIYMQRMELHMLEVFKQYREHFESQKRDLERRYRQMLRDSVQDAVHLQKKTLELQAQVDFLNKEVDDSGE